MKRILSAIVLLLAAVVSIVIIKTALFKSRQLSFPTKKAPPLSDIATSHLSRAIGFKTISYGDSSRMDTAQFLGFRKFLATTFPKVHQTLALEVVNGYTLLYTWKGKDLERKPVVLMGHQDVVPVEEASKEKWTVDPFAGTIRDGFIWGRGAADDKINVIAIMEAIEKLVGEGFTPDRTIYLSFGHDEEMGGFGAKAVAQLMKSRNITAELILDEGGLITREKVPGMKEAVALIGTSEKGYLSLELSADINGGHSSMPEKETSIDILTKAIIRLREKPFEWNYSPSMKGFLNNVGPEMPFTSKMAFANQWLFSPVINSIYEQSAAGNAMIRTTLVPTIIDAGVKDNVVPTRATATINLRLLPGDSSAKVINAVRQIVSDDRVAIKVLTSFLAEPSAVTSEESFAYQKVNETIKTTFDNIITTPFLMIGGTDSRHFAEVSTGIIKFSPMIDPVGFHGIDERVSLETYQGAIWFYETLMRSL